MVREERVPHLSHDAIKPGCLFCELVMSGGQMLETVHIHGSCQAGHHARPLH